MPGASTRDRFATLMARPVVAPDELFEILADRRTADDEEIPDTGLPADWERALSAPFVVHGTYGTRSSAALLVDEGGRTTMIERRYDRYATLSSATRMSFDTAREPNRRTQRVDMEHAAQRAPGGQLESVAE
jgi:uncharacterized protein with NRDE domain